MSGMTARDIISRWPTRAALAADVSRPPSTVHSWWQRNSIPGDVDLLLLASAKERGVSLTLEELAFARRSRPEGEAA